MWDCLDAVDPSLDHLDNGDAGRIVIELIVHAMVDEERQPATQLK